MSAVEKSERRLLADPHEAHFSDVQRVLEAHGWSLVRVPSSHHSFAKQGETDIITIPVHGRRVTRTYVRMVVKRLRLGAK